MWSISKLVVSAALTLLAPADTRPGKPGREDSVIYWSPGTRLIGADFKQPALSESVYSAGSHLGTDMEISADGEHLKFTVHAYFVPDKSWIKVQDADLLLHEQTHFDIEEYYARLIRKELAHLQVKDRSFEAVRTDADAILTRMLTERTRVQEKFDEETGHSVNTDKEKEWERKIRDLLFDTRAQAPTELYFVL